ncbi:MAG TPA: LON peptidase substrate-binding domain-containing protein [Thermoanaerobaculia bacterium]|nr:LON peptidase substrate-binding domain-containing protein [Thermoanaerobaculia bacterium]
MEPEIFPAVLPIFPLAAPLLLPGTVVPLLAADARYRNLLEDALSSDSYVGVLQPVFGEAGEIGLPGEGPALYQVGCLGRIGECREEGDGGYVALVEGVIRFRTSGEVPGRNGYRRMAVDYGEFLEDPEAIEQELDFSVLKEVVRQRVEANGSPLDLSIMDEMVGTEIVTALAHALPFSSAERQALVEIPSLRELQPMLLQLMTMGPGGRLGFDLPPFLPS